MKEQNQSSKTPQPRRYWMSLDQYENPEQFSKDHSGEFLQEPKQSAQEHGVNRREFLKVMGASSLMASMAGCTRRPVQKIVPYVTKPEYITPGIPNYYTSVDPKTGQGLVLLTREGRPIKVDGNPEFPGGGRAIGARGQASVLDLYDPDRLRAPMLDGKSTTWEDFDKAVGKGSSSGNDVYFLTSTLMDPSLRRLIRKFSRNHVEYDSLPMEDIREGQRSSYGISVVPHYRLDKVRVLVTIDADILDTMISPEEFLRKFVKTRDLSKNGISRFFAFESSMRLTGQNADTRISIHPGDQLRLGLSLAYEVSRKMGRKVKGLDAYSASKIAEDLGLDAKLIKSVASELSRNRGRSLVLAGGTGGKSSSAVALQNVVNYLNSILGADGRVVDTEEGPLFSNRGSHREVRKLVSDMQAGKVKTLVIQGVNPVASLPKSMGFFDALKNVKNVVYLSQFYDETAAVSRFVGAESHPFEAWGESNPSKGLFAVQQPTIRPLWDTRSLGDMLIAWGQSGGVNTGVENSYELVRKSWQSLHWKFSSGSSFESFWEAALEKGFFDAVGAKRFTANAKPREYRDDALRAAIRMAASRPKYQSDTKFTLVLQHSIGLGDGAQANNAQLQELPDPVTKITWGNYVSMAPSTAKRLGIKDGDVVKLENSAHSAEIPAHVQPGLRSDVLVASLGYGRSFKGRVGNGVGVRMEDFVQSIDDHFSFAAAGIQVTKTGNFDQLASTQTHHSMEGRDIVFETNYEDYRRNASSGIVHHMDKLDSIWSGHDYPGYRWGMVIDMNKCSGCSSCVTACGVENNVPTVGKQEVILGREMHWIRLDRYYSGDSENPETALQPILCMHCENAPCESVCPVLATVHSSDGLNQMIYNRCVGTRYCANNCPYKVRRFNFYELNQPLNGTLEHPIPLSKNPEVTLRSRGVMEKCSFCRQRITIAKSGARRDGRTVQDSDLQTACQQACPSEAIYFGNVNNRDAEVSKQRRDPRAYKVLEEVLAGPMVQYLTKVWNRTPKPDSADGPQAGGH